MNIKRTVNFKLEQRKMKGVVAKENVPIRMRLSFGGNRIEFSTGYRVDADKWDAQDDSTYIISLENDGEPDTLDESAITETPETEVAS